MIKKNFSLSDPSISTLEIKEVNKMMKNGWNNYNYVEKFEETFAKYHNKKYALMTSCCTHAIHLVIKSLNLKKKDEIIIPNSTWVSSAFPAAYENVKIIFADVEKDNWCLDVQNLKNYISKNTKAILFVDLYGNIPNVKKIKKIINKKNIILIEDAAEALGSKYHGLKAGTLGDVGVFSFHRTKTITTGEGGMLITNNKKIYLSCKHMRDLGRLKKQPYYSSLIAPKYMPSNISACIGLTQFKRLKNLIKKKRWIYKTYKKELSFIKCLNFNQDNKTNFNSAWATTIVLKKNSKMNSHKMINTLAKSGIPSRPFFFPLSEMEAFKKYSNKKVFKRNNSIYLNKFGITLPSGYDLRLDQIKYISKKVINILNNAGLN
jgi:perosamine synthetase